MKAYARVEDARVMELYAAPESITPGEGGVLTGLPGEWIGLTKVQARNVTDQWSYRDGEFISPGSPSVEAKEGI
jgi:hypothetical protein